MKSFKTNKESIGVQHFFEDTDNIFLQMKMF